jgi:hypothetical protein
MIRTKTFDCVEMKDQAQARLAEEYAKYGRSQQEQRLKDELAHSDDVVAQKWRRVVGLAASNPPPPYKGSFPINDEFIDRAKREGRE